MWYDNMGRGGQGGMPLSILCSSIRQRTMAVCSCGRRGLVWGRLGLVEFPNVVAIVELVFGVVKLNGLVVGTVEFNGFVSTVELNGLVVGSVLVVLASVSFSSLVPTSLLKGFLASRRFHLSATGRPWCGLYIRCGEWGGGKIYSVFARTPGTVFNVMAQKFIVEIETNKRCHVDNFYVTQESEGIHVVQFDPFNELKPKN